MWVYRFMKQLPDGFKCQKQKPIDPKQMESEDVSRVAFWYDQFEILMQQYQIQPSDLYNFDEIGFLEGQGRAQSVITQNPERNENIGSSFSRNSLTIIECASADGSVLPPCIILKGSHFLEDWFTHSTMPESWLLATSENGFITDQIAFKWIQHFNEYSKKRQVR